MTTAHTSFGPAPATTPTSAREQLPLDAPMSFIPRGWKDDVTTEAGKIDRAMWETQLAIAIRDAKRLFFGNHGVFRIGDLEQLTSKASALSVLCNAVVFWNTIQTEDILTKLRDERPVDEEWLSFLTPLAHAHVVVNGIYRFDDEERSGT